MFDAGGGAEDSVAFARGGRDWLWILARAESIRIDDDLWLGISFAVTKLASRAALAPHPLGSGEAAGSPECFNLLSRPNSEGYLDGRKNIVLGLLSLVAAIPILGRSAQRLASGYFGFPTRSSSENLSIKRYVAAGDRAYEVGTLDGAFPQIGWHVKGGMNGLWAPPH